MMKLLRALYALWMKFAFFLGTINRYVLMTVFYFVVINVVNIIVRIGRIDLLDRRMRPQLSYWHSKKPMPKTYRHQF